MKIEYIEFIDYSLKWLYDKDNEYGSDFQTISYNYKKMHGIDYDDDFCEKLTRVLEKDALIEPSSNNGMYRVTSKAIEIILENGSYLNFVKSKNEYIDRQKEIEDLNFKVNKLQADKLEYQITLRDKEAIISDLDLRVKKWSLFKSYWWITATIYAIGVQIIVEIATSRELVIAGIRWLIHLML